MTDLTPMVTATIDYGDWLRRQVDVVEADLHLKHRQMASSLFTFLRATFASRNEPLAEGTHEMHGADLSGPPGTPHGFMEKQLLSSADKLTEVSPNRTSFPRAQRSPLRPLLQT